MNTRTRVAAVAAAATLSMIATAASATVNPISVDEALDPGGSITITKTVSTPELPPQPDIVLLVDRTGSMTSAIAGVKANMASIISTVSASQPEAQWAVASYCDVGEPDPFLLHSDLTDDTAATVAAVNGITLCSGGDEAEEQLNALWEIGDGGDAVAFRPDSSRIVVWFGDAPGRDPSLGHTLADATASLTDAEARVVAISVGVDNLDSTGQATAITTATSGTLLSGVGADEVSAAIVEGLSNLPVQVAGAPDCDDGLTVTLDPASQTVTSGEDAVFEETITAAADAPQGTTLTCETEFTLNGADAGAGFTQSISIWINDVTPPTVSCEPGPNPSGNMPGSTNSGFYQMFSTDNVDAAVDIYIHDLGSSAIFGPYATGTTFKLTQAPGATPSVVPFHRAVDWKVKLNGDALLVATDAAGNTASAECEVPPQD
ncbi:VWA domain-containing protein [Ornithinimicrobium sp. F0845]|uniref:vWA domain-containing protein n=1 Tax=Ornithinimicrobium sp. F0845 TaxID=2926412 RepID=UPI001FF6D895|nr:vWA domain-containing protein [Ornithinimicrobium sp. F0845]MCK0111714.1 VWA domain-containing protein [Ornithinimicrobium sp. F0845]